MFEAYPKSCSEISMSLWILNNLLSDDDKNVAKNLFNIMDLNIVIEPCLQTKNQELIIELALLFKNHFSLFNLSPLVVLNLLKNCSDTVG